MIATGRGHEGRASWWLGVAKPTEIQETLLPHMYVLAPVEFNSAALSSDCVAHRFGNATGARAHAEKAIEAFAKTYGAKFPKAVAKITEDREELLAFYGFPAEHWIHLRTTNPIESTFSTVKLRTKVTRGAGSPAAALAMVCELVGSAQTRWRAISGAHLVALVRSGAGFENGVSVERLENTAA